MRDRLPPSCLELLNVQHGVLSRRQALECGMSVTEIRGRIRNGRWQRLHQGVYATFTGEPPRLALIWSAVLSAGSGAAASHDTAAELYRLGRGSAGAIHVTIPAARTVQRVSRPGRQESTWGLPPLVVHRSDRILRTRHPVLRPARTRIEETVIDLTQSAATFEDAFNWLCQACGSRLATAGMLRQALDQRKKLRYRQDLLVALADVADGVHSPLENRYVRGVERPHGLPAARRQARMSPGARRRYLDNLYQDYHLVVELDGAATHPTAERWQDIHRDNSMARIGLETMRYNWADVTGRPCGVAAEIAAVLVRRGWPGPLRRCDPGCRALP
jgi:predicted transcriptional regulator of viral defense system